MHIRSCSELGKRISTYRFQNISSTRHLCSKRVTVASKSKMIKKIPAARELPKIIESECWTLCLLPNWKRKFRARSPRCSDGDCLLL